MLRTQAKSTLYSVSTLYFTSLVSLQAAFVDDIKYCIGKDGTADAHENTAYYFQGQQSNLHSTSN